MKKLLLLLLLFGFNANAEKWEYVRFDWFNFDATLQGTYKGKHFELDIELVRKPDGWNEIFGQEPKDQETLTIFNFIGGLGYELVSSPKTNAHYFKRKLSVPKKKED